MAGAAMTDIKSRIKSVNGTMQITKAMELVATSKLRRAKESAERTRPFGDMLREAISTVLASPEVSLHSLFKARDGAKELLVVIAGDRGLAGGYNAGVFRLAATLSDPKSTVYLPLGKKAFEHYTHKGAEVIISEPTYVSDLSVSDSFDLAESIISGCKSGEYSSVKIVYTKFVSMLTQTPVEEQIFPFKLSAGDTDCDVMLGGEAEEIIDGILPFYLGGIIYSAITEASAAESAARRTAMNAANKNASEMIDSLMLKYNRARQAIITQEITEIVSGAEAL
ncbi:MAG: ATP synthase F1 subunit gamma [Clostridia bacterium]|nr:ATP synthase F1 subunit gamma [Clostridia bacterium]